MHTTKLSPGELGLLTGLIRDQQRNQLKADEAIRAVGRVWGYLGPEARRVADVLFAGAQDAEIADEVSFVRDQARLQPVDF